MIHLHAAQRNLAPPERFDVDAELQHVCVKERRSPRRLPPVQGKAVEPCGKGSPTKVKIAELHSRPGRPCQILDDCFPRPAIRESGGDRIDDCEDNKGDQGGTEPQPMFPSEFAFPLAHRFLSRTYLTTCRERARFQSSIAILFRPAILP